MCQGEYLVAMLAQTPASLRFAHVGVDVAALVVAAGTVWDNIGEAVVQIKTVLWRDCPNIHSHFDAFRNELERYISGLEDANKYVVRYWYRRQPLWVRRAAVARWFVIRIAAPAKRDEER